MIANRRTISILEALRISVGANDVHAFFGD